MRSRASVATVRMAVVTLLGGLTVTGCSSSTPSAGTGGEPPGIQAAHHFSGTPAVGPLFPPGGGVHTCTASVVNSPPGNVLITAAHCISGTAHGYTFAPGYHKGVQPFGTWMVVGVYANPEWIGHQAPQGDYAFLEVAPHQVAGRPVQIQEVTGGNQLGTAPAPGERVTIPAYIAGRDDDPITCAARVYFRARYPAFNCDSYVGGSSGSPWLWRSRHGWVVVGVIGGLFQGGCYPWSSYSPAFGQMTAQAYAHAITGASPSTLPPAGSDGCSSGP